MSDRACGAAQVRHPVVLATGCRQSYVADMKRIIATGVLLYAAAFGFLVLGQGWLIYPFDPTEVSPRAAGVPDMAATRMVTGDGASLVVWTHPARPGKATIVYFHGNAGNLAVRAARFDRLLDHGYGVVAMAYRGSSGSSGSPSEAAIRADTDRLFDSLSSLLGNQPETLVYYGESLGSAVAVSLALRHPPDGLVLEAPFTSIADVAQRRLPVFPVRLGLTERWDTLTVIGQVRMPLLVMHGTADQVVPFTQGRAVYEAAGSDRKQFRAVQGLGHTGHWSVPGQTAIYSFVESL